MTHSRTGHLRGVTLRTNPVGPTPRTSRFQIDQAAWHARLAGFNDAGASAPVTIGPERTVRLDTDRPAA